MDKKILIAFGTAAGSTAEVAQAIAKTMKDSGANVDIFPVEEIKKIEGYDAVVVGSAVRMFHLIPKTRQFLRRNRRALQSLPVAYFLVCLTMSEKTSENIERATKFAEPMIKVRRPVSLGLFGGCIDHEKLTDPFGKMLKTVPEQDHRDWEEIHTWAQDTLTKLV